MDLLKIASEVSHVVELLPMNTKLAPKDLALVSAFTADPESYYDQKADAKASYSPASATIQGILKDMYDTFTADLERITEDEASAQKAFEDLMATKAKELATLKATLEKKEAAKAEAEKMLADAAQELADTTAQMKEDTKFFDEMTVACKAKADEWGERSRLRTEEIAGINKALEVLTSDEARALFNKAIKPGIETFIQLDEQTENSPRIKAFKALKRQATKSHSLRLAALAATVRSAGQFDVVIAEIDKMIKVLKDEEAEDIDQRDFCKETTFEKEQEKSRYEYKIEKTEAKIVKLTEKKEELEAAIIETDAQILSTHEDLDQMEATRTEENAQFKQAKSDDEAAIELLGQAIEHLSAYYKNNKIEIGPIQGSVKGLLQEPEFAVDPDQAPDATFSGKGSRKNESKGIISILTMIKEDLQEEIANGMKAEEMSQQEYAKAKAAALKLIATLEEKKTNLEEAKAETDVKIGDAETLQEETEKMLKAKEEELQEMKPNCDWIMKAFETRREKRKAEMEGLLQAKSYLSGAAPSMLEKSVDFDDEMLPSLKFESVSFLQRRKLGV